MAIMASLSMLSLLKIRKSSKLLTANKNFFEVRHTSDSNHFEAEKNKQSFLELFASKGKRKFPGYHRLDPFKFNLGRFQEWKSDISEDIEIHGQRFLEQRHKVMGCDLASAHFVIYRGGSVKFIGHDDWISIDPKEQVCDELPDKFDPTYRLEAIDLSNTKIRYEGLENFIHLDHLKWLSLRNCSHVDDWFIDKISFLFSQTLEHLDISDCYNVTERSFSCLYRFNSLKSLAVENISHNKLFEFSCLLAEDCLPSLTIKGVQYMSLTE